MGAKVSNADAHRGVEEFTWGEYRVWAKTATALKRRVTRVRKWILYLTLVSAVLGALAAQASVQASYLQTLGATWFPPVVGTIAGLLLTIGGILTRQLSLRKKREDQVRARSAAEALKSAVFLYVTRAPPYDQEDAPRLLHDDTEEILANVDDVRNEDVTGAEKKIGLPPYPMSPESYVQNRVQEQIDWYRIKQTEHGRAMQNGERAALCFAFAGAVLAALAGLSSQWPSLSVASGWIPVIGAISAAVAAYLYAERHEYLELSYRSTGRRLSRLLSRRASNLADRPDLSAQLAFINRCEDAVSVENQSWMAELMKEDNAK